MVKNQQNLSKKLFLSLKYLILLTFKVKTKKKIGHVFLGLFTWNHPIFLRRFLILKGIQIALPVQKLQQFCWMGGYCLLVELQRWRVCACSLRSRLVYESCIALLNHCSATQYKPNCQNLNLSFSPKLPKKGHQF